MISRTAQIARQRVSLSTALLTPLQTQRALIPSTIRLISSTKETVGGTKTDHREELKHKSQSQKAEPYSQNSEDTSYHGGSQGGAGKSANPKAERKGNSGTHQEPHAGSMGQS